MTYYARDIIKITDAEILEIVKTMINDPDKTKVHYASWEQWEYNADEEAMFSIIGQQLFKPKDKISLTSKQRKYVEVFIFRYNTDVPFHDRDYHKKYTREHSGRKRNWSGNNPYYHPVGGDYTDYF